MNKPQVWLIGGTSESAELAKALSAQAIPYILTVTTLAAKRLYPEQANVRVGAMAPDTMTDFVVSQNVRCILDASHPFATAISQQVIALCHSSHTTPNTQPTFSYLRYERPTLKSTDELTESIHSPGQITTVKEVEALLTSDLLHHQRVLFTLGYRYLSLFAPLRQTSKLFARVLPSPEAIAGAIASGFSSEEIIAMRPPISLALEKSLWQQWKISQVVAKASGQPGGEAIKRQAAAELGIHLILLQRPSIRYPRQTHCVSEAINFCANALRLY